MMCSDLLWSALSTAGTPMTLRNAGDDRLVVCGMRLAPNDAATSGTGPSGP